MSNVSNNKHCLPERIQKIIQKRLNPNLIKTREVSGRPMRYISGSTVVDILNNAFDYMWNWEADREWITQGTPFWNKNWKDETNKPVGRWEDQGPVCHVHGVLTVYFDDDEGNPCSIVKTGYGSKCIIGKQSEQDSIYKAAETDALKKAASRLGIGAELYRSEEENDYFASMTDPTIWTQETLDKYQNQLEYIRAVCENMSAEDISTMLSSFGYDCSTLSDINPTNIDAFVYFLNNGTADEIKKAEQENKEEESASIQPPKKKLSLNKKG